MKKLIFSALILTYSLFAVELTKQQAATVGAASGAIIGAVASDLLQPYAGQYAQPVVTTISAATGAYIGYSLGADPKQPIKQRKSQ